MRLHPRHYVLLALLILVAAWNLVRRSRAHHEAATAAVSSGSSTPGWQAFDHAAGLRDAPDGQFTPALDALRAQSESATGPEASDLRGCQMWLLYYRHSAPTASGKSGDWGSLATSHVQSCVANHRDIGR